MSYIDGENYNFINFANLTGDDALVVEDLVINNSLTLPPQFTGINLTSNNVSYNINNLELSNLNGSRSNLQQQIDNLNPDPSGNRGYWGTFWNNNDLSGNANSVLYISYTNADPSSNGIVYNNSTHIQVENAGVYLFVITAQVYSSNSNVATIDFWIKKNGTNVADSAFKYEIKQSTLLITANWQLQLLENDYLEFVWQTNDASVKLEHFNASGNIPQIPSVIITASQITYYQNNTAQVEGILQRITDISYNQPTDTTIITNNLNVNGALHISGASNLNITSILGTLGVSGATSLNQTDISGNLSVSGRITRPTYISPATNNEYVMKEYVDSQDTYYYGLNQTAINNANTNINQLNLITTGINYNSGTDTTTIDNNVVISNGKNLSIQVSNGSSVPLNSYIDQQVAIAYGRGSDGVNQAQNAQNTANNALNTANNAQNTADGAMSLASGASAGVAGLGVVVSQHTTDIAGLGGALALTDANVAGLQAKTQNINAIPAETTFTGQVIVGDTTINPLSILTPTLDAETAVITPSISSNTATINITPAVQNLQGTTINIGKSVGGSSVNIATDGVNSVSIGNLLTPVYINSVLYTPFNPASFLTQF